MRSKQSIGASSKTFLRFSVKIFTDTVSNWTFSFGHSRSRIRTEKGRIVLKGDVSSPIALPSGCRIHTRCPFVTVLWHKQEPRG